MKTNHTQSYNSNLIFLSQILFSPRLLVQISQNHQLLQLLRKQYLFNKKMVKHSDNDYSNNQNDSSYGDGKRENQSNKSSSSGSKKEKHIKKEKPKKTSNKQKKPYVQVDGQKVPIRPFRMDQENGEYIYNDAESLEMCDLQKPYIPNNPDQNNSDQNNVDQNQASQDPLSEDYRSKSMSSHGSQMDSGDQLDEDDIQDLRMLWVEFFNSIDQPNGLVFKAEYRKWLNKQYGKKIKFTAEHDLDPEGEEIKKIQPHVTELAIFNLKNHRADRIPGDFQSYIKNDLKKMITTFKQSSYIFCKEVTQELYSILAEICSIVLKFRTIDEKQKRSNEEKQKPKENLQGKVEILKPKQNSEMIKQLRLFGDKIASRGDDNPYFFFGYKFSEPFPTEKEEIKKTASKEKQNSKKPKKPKIVQNSGKLTAQDEREDILSKKDKYKYTLKTRYTVKNKQFADFVEKAGIHLYKILSELDCYQTFK